MVYVPQFLKNRLAQPTTTRSRPPALGKALGTGRIEAFSDGVFAVAITLLVLNLQVPTGDAGVAIKDGGQLLQHLQDLIPKFLVYALSFVIVGIYWVSHHNTFNYIKRSDRILLWINILLLMCIVFIPFPTALLGLYWDRPIAITIYAGTLILTGLVIQLLWWYATSYHRLVEKDIDPNLVKRATSRNLLAPKIYLVAIIASFLNVYLSLFIILMVPIIYIVPGRIDRHWATRHLQQELEEIESELKPPPMPPV